MRSGLTVAYYISVTCSVKRNYDAENIVSWDRAHRFQTRQSENSSPSLQEAEAECVTLFCCEALGPEGAEYARGYVQHWL